MRVRSLFIPVSQKEDSTLTISNNEKVKYLKELKDVHILTEAEFSRLASMPLKMYKQGGDDAISLNNVES